jgi:transcriptional regulator with PAS, ATPase and Fis domain
LKTPFITLNCSAISESLFESELFGYETGAFTGAKAAGMIGKMELAQGGTLFLDEIGELPLSMQPKLLRALQQREIFRIGGNTCVKLNIRIICATNRNLALELEKGNFREDLYYRLNTGKITIPPLSERKEEIAPLAQVFLIEFTKEKKKSFRSIENAAIRLLESYAWPGNVRELRNVVERATLLYDDLELKAEHLDFLNHKKSPDQSSRKITIDLPEGGIDYSEIERRIFQKGLELCDGNKTQLAKLLNISVKTIYRRDL